MRHVSNQNKAVTLQQCPLRHRMPSSCSSGQARAQALLQVCFITIVLVQDIVTRLNLFSLSLSLTVYRRSFVAFYGSRLPIPSVRWCPLLLSPGCTWGCWRRHSWRLMGQKRHTHTHKHEQTHIWLYHWRDPDKANRQLWPAGVKMQSTRITESANGSVTQSCNLFQW